MCRLMSAEIAADAGFGPKATRPASREVARRKRRILNLLLESGASIVVPVTRARSRRRSRGGPTAGAVPAPAWCPDRVQGERERAESAQNAPSRTLVHAVCIPVPQGGHAPPHSCPRGVRGWCGAATPHPQAPLPPPRLKNWTAFSCFSAAALEPNVPRFRRLPVFGSFFFE